MSLDHDTVRRIARLARIAVSDEELAATCDELNRILALVAQLQAVDTAGVEPMAHAQEMTARLRPDEVTERDQRELFQSVAPETEAGLYLVPRVIE